MIPSVYVKMAIENGHRNSGFFPLKMLIFHSYVSLPEGIHGRGMLWNVVFNRDRSEEGDIPPPT